jgi:uncharacterized protein (DUF1501 family)/uncharacterized protein (DUF1800 family)
MERNPMYTHNTDSSQGLNTYPRFDSEDDSDGDVAQFPARPPPLPARRGVVPPVPPPRSYAVPPVPPPRSYAVPPVPPPRHYNKPVPPLPEPRMQNYVKPMEMENGSTLNAPQKHQRTPIQVPCIGYAIIALLAIGSVSFGILVATGSIELFGSDPFEQPLPPASQGELYLLESTSQLQPSGARRIVARSYDGNTWEAMPDANFDPVDISCTGSACTIFTSDDYVVRKVKVPATLANAPSKMHAARLLSQGAFGAPLEEVNRVAAAYGRNAGDWVRDQMRIDQTSARAYFRRRANPRLVPGATAPQPQTSPCDFDTRWHSYVFETRDVGQDLHLTGNDGTGRYVLTINGTVRGELTTFATVPYPGTALEFFHPSKSAVYRICRVMEGTHSEVRLLLPDGGSGRSCGTNSDLLRILNPAINFTSPITTHGSAYQVLDTAQAEFAPVQGGFTGSAVMSWRGIPCTLQMNPAGNAFIRYGPSTYLRFDRRLRYWSNTIDQPSLGGPGADANGQCPLVTSTFVNRDRCVRRPSCGDEAPIFGAAVVNLTEPTLRAWYTDSEASRVVYYITGLRLESPYDVSPCVSRYSRWLRVSAAPCSQGVTAGLDSTTRATFVSALSSSVDTNPHVRDIVLTGANCDSSNAATIGARVEAAGVCWQHVHPDSHSVRDATRWTEIHDGNVVAMAGGGRNPIRRWAADGGVNLVFPMSHPMSRWALRSRELPLIGRFGDRVSFSSLMPELQTTAMALRFGALRNQPQDSTVACGSHDEVSNVPALGMHYFSRQYANQRRTDVDPLEWRMPIAYQHRFVINNIMVKAPDQLRQRVTWSLSNFLIISTDALGFSDRPEVFLAYWDILARHAFGNFYDLLREISWTSAMSRYLTYENSRSYFSSGSYPDENYAREVMQLFSIGLWKLNDDGTYKRDAYGEPIATYTNEDIVDYARIWTGFIRQAGRINFHDTPLNPYLDPLQLRASYRDRLPKAKLDRGHIGDGYPICDELPARHWLLKGARFEYTGSSSVEGDAIDSAAPTDPAGRRGRFAPSPGGQSALYNALCGAPAVGQPCTFPLTVTLPQTLTCHGDQECNAARVITVQIVDPIGNITQYYHYQEPPCVRLALFEEGKRLHRSGSTDQCGDPSTVRGVPACCNPDNLGGGIVTSYGPECKFTNEAMTYAEAEQRCADQQLAVCTRTRRTPNWERTCAEGVFAWTDTDCRVQIQVYANERIGLVEELASRSMLEPNSFNFFRARWNNGRAPTARNGQCPADTDCQLQPTVEGDSCICNVTVTTTTVYETFSDLKQATVAAVANSLHIGAVSPDMYNSGNDYEQCNTAICNALVSRNRITVWLHTGDGGDLTNRTIIEIPPYRTGGSRRLLFNRVSTVYVGNNAGDPDSDNRNMYSFRNPPAFIPLLGWVREPGRTWDSSNLWVRKLEYETNALLQHLAEHDSTAPFVSRHLIQNMVTSNPSPRFVRKVVRAFRSGAVGDVKFSERYGDIGAAVYAILTDREARSPVVLADPGYGMVLDPLVKLMHLTRSLNYQSARGREMVMQGLTNDIGVQALDAPSVFNFYSPFYQPDGIIIDSGLYSPQAELLTPPLMIGFLNGAYSLIDHGLTSCDYGFGTWEHNESRSCNRPSEQADGFLTHISNVVAQTTEDIVNELSLVLTAGRVVPGGVTHQVAVEEYDRVFADTNDKVAATKHITKLLVSAPEFHTSTLHRVQETERTTESEAASLGRSPKIIVVLNLRGGCDSFNLIVPHSGCGAKDLFAEYTDVRGGAALSTNQLLTIDAGVSSQPCSTFGMHSAMPRLHQLYQDNDLLWLSGIGALVEPVTLSEYKKKAKKLPPSLFSHNVMQRSMVNVHAQSSSAKGIVGRAMDTLASMPFPYAVSMAGLGSSIEVLRSERVPHDVLSTSGSVAKLQDQNALGDGLENLASNISESVFSETYARELLEAITSTERLSKVLSSTTLETAEFGDYSRTAQSFQTAAKLIKSRISNGTERMGFALSKGGFDTHNTYDLDPLFDDFDYSIGKFADELKAQGVWDNTVVVVVSEFGRTLRSNGRGTDHAWSGNAFITGGAVKGGRIIGQYPENLTEEGDNSLGGRGRLLPTTSWEAMWNGVLEWYGVPANRMSEVLPNAASFAGNGLFTKADLFD